MMRKYRKKPIEVEALQWKNNHIEMGEFLNRKNIRSYHRYGTSTLHLHTLEGEMIAQEGDYIIKGIKGEFYPCKPDIFEATYEEVK